MRQNGHAEAGPTVAEGAAGAAGERGPAGELVAVVGATATGKSALAVELALELGGEVINADSMQLYRGMDIGTAKITKDEQKNVPHHLLDIWDVTKTASVAEYRRLADITIEDITSRGKLPILVGGSGLYIRAALGELDFPGTDSEVRARLERELKETGPGPLHERLQEQDPRAAEQILPSNGRRIVRALEVIEISGASFSAKMPKYGGGRPALQVGLAMPRPELDQRVAERVDRMWAAGLVEEVKKLEQSGLRDGLTASRALGYAQVLRFLEGQCTEPEAKNETVKATRRFVRRQESWFRRDPRVAWADDAGSARELVRRSVA